MRRKRRRGRTREKGSKKEEMKDSGKVEKKKKRDNSDREKKVKRTKNNRLRYRRMTSTERRGNK